MWWEIKYHYDETMKYLKSEPEQTTPERVKLNPPNKTGRRLKILTPNELLTRIPIFLSQIKAGNNSTDNQSDIYLLYQHNKITKNITKN